MTTTEPQSQEQQQPKKRAGSIRQYATLGGGKTSERPNAQTSSLPSAPTLERQSVPTLERQDVEALKRSDVQTPQAQRTRHTIYFPPELSKWLKHRAVDQGREISEIVTEALEQYKSAVE
jgi:hypothetical protein